jgi:hypothetical protein
MRHSGTSCGNIIGRWACVLPSRQALNRKPAASAGNEREPMRLEAVTAAGPASRPRPGIEPRRCGLFAGLCFAIVVTAGPALAQNPGTSGGGGQPSPGRNAADAPQNVPSLQLSDAQRQTIYQSISTRRSKKDTAPPGFRPAVGAQVPASIKLEPLPKAVVELVPKTADFQYAFVANQVLIVDPRSRTVVEVIH